MFSWFLLIREIFHKCSIKLNLLCKAKNVNKQIREPVLVILNVTGQAQDLTGVDMTAIKQRVIGFIQFSFQFSVFIYL